VLINFRKSKNDTLKVQSEKILNYYWRAHDHSVCCCLRRKSIQLHGIYDILLGWRKPGLSIATGKPTEIAI